jgi:hypothetical protein
MSVRAIDENRDWQFGQGKQSYKNRIEEIGQMIQTRVLSFLGDCFFAVEEGIDWVNLLAKGSSKEEELKRSISLTILETPGVVALNKLELVNDRQTRRLVIDYSVATIYSTNYLGSIGVENG